MLKYARKMNENNKIIKFEKEEEDVKNDEEGRGIHILRNEFSVKYRH